MPNTDAAIRLHRFRLSGHAHRAELMLSLLGLPHQLIDVDLPKGAHKAPAFLALNPFGQVPVLEDGENIIADSNAILVYLALRYDESERWLPRAPVAAAHVQRWLSVAAGELAQGPAAARRAKLFGAKLDLAQAGALATQLFTVIEQTVQTAEFLVGGGATIADVALYSYVKHAPDGELSLADYPALRRWLVRIESLPGFVPMGRHITPPAGV